MGFGIEARINKHVETTANPSMEIDSKEQITNSNRAPKDQPDTENITSAALKSSEPSLHPVPTNEEQRTDELTNTKVTEANYEVTAYYLNVRAEADGTSKIIDVVTKGSILEVVKPTDNGWLELKSGGYIHGNYAKWISGEVKQFAQVNKIPDEQTAENMVGQAPQPAIDVKSAEPSKPSSTVKSNSGLTEEHIAKIIKDTALEGEGLEEAILEIEKTYGINSYFTIAVMKLESGHGKSQIAKTKNNLFGLNAIDSDSYNKALSFTTKGESVKKFGHIISEFYIDKGLTSVEKVARKYCGANSNWPVLVKSIMNSDYKKIL
jgi:flagellum-specific peptidoglycan hydrolase FlgJ